MFNNSFCSVCLSCLILSLTSSFISSASAQIVPDTTLPVNSLVTRKGNATTITGGTRAGNNLFHSFEQFSISTGGTAYFNNALDIQNIFGRVTGGSISNIEGILRANGSANLFLVNPNGVIFGPNASLNIGGSFLGSTASSINFADRTQFSANTPQTTPLLTISVPIGLKFEANPGIIRVQGTGHTQYVYGNNAAASITLSGPGQSQNGLRLQPGKTLALIGGNVIFEGGVVTAPSGRIEVGSVDSGTIEIKPALSGLNLGYEGVKNFQDIQLTKQSLLDASGVLFGDIHMQGKNITFTDGSLALVANLGQSDSGAIRINASSLLSMTGITPFNIQPFLGNKRINRGIITETVFGKGADIIISTKQLIAQDSELIALLTFGSGSTGNLTIDSADSVKVLGVSPNESSGVASIFGTITYGSGQAGNVSLTTKQLLVEDSGTLESLTFGSGAGGNVNINASDFVKVSGGYAVDVLLAYGTEPISSFSPSSILSQSISSGNAGNIYVSTKLLSIENGGRIAASGLKTGRSGDITINTSDSINVSGSGSVNPSLSPSTITSSVSAVDPFLNYLYNINQTPNALSGNITINTLRLKVTDGALISVRNDGTKNGGILGINARSIFLDNRGSITASTASSEGGNISVSAKDFRLQRGSSIDASALGGMKEGGNITFNTDTLVMLDSSRVKADAFGGPGGNIQINAQGLFRSSDSVFSASSRLGINGTVRINTLDVFPGRDIAVLPVRPTDLTKLIAQGCPAGAGPHGTKFVVTGNGGLPPSPSDPQGGDRVLEDWGTVASSPANTLSTSDRSNSATDSADDIENAPPSDKYEYDGRPLVEAQGFATNSKGQVVLVAHASTLTPDVPWLKSPSCHAQ